MGGWDVPAAVAAVLDGLQDGHALYAPELADDGSVTSLSGVYINPAGMRQRRLSPRRFRTEDLLARTRGLGNPAVADRYAAVVATGRPMVRTLVTDELTGRPRTFEVNAARVPVEGRTLLSMWFRDVTHELNAQRRLREAALASDQLSRTDALTGLLNRRGWEAALRQRMSAATRGGSPLSVAIADIDHFKAYNDGRGHLVGDDLLAALAGGWSLRLPEGLALARLGGEEFAFVVPEELDVAVPTIETLRCDVPDGQTVSVGVAQRRPGETARELMSRADEALYEAKRSGRDRLVRAAP